MVWDFPGKDGTTLRQHVENIKSNPDSALALKGYPDQPEVPYGGEYVWDLFWVLREGTGSNGFSPNPISYQELLAFSKLTGIALSGFVVKALRRMDSKYLEYVSEQNKKSA